VLVLGRWVLYHLSHSPSPHFLSLHPCNKPSELHFPRLETASERQSTQQGSDLLGGVSPGLAGDAGVLYQVEGVRPQETNTLSLTPHILPGCEIFLFCLLPRI
jgi:hypothetical protein